MLLSNVKRASLCKPFTRLLLTGKRSVLAKAELTVTKESTSLVTSHYPFYGQSILNLLKKTDTLPYKQ